MLGLFYLGLTGSVAQVSNHTTFSSLLMALVVLCGRP